MCSSGVVLAAAAALLPAGPATADGAKPKAAGSEGGRGGYAGILRQQSVWSLAGWQCLRTVFWGAASLSMPFLLFEFTRSQLVVGVFQLVAIRG